MFGQGLLLLFNHCLSEKGVSREWLSVLIRSCRIQIWINSFIYLFTMKTNSFQLTWITFWMPNHSIRIQIFKMGGVRNRLFWNFCSLSVWYPFHWIYLLCFIDIIYMSIKLVFLTFFIESFILNQAEWYSWTLLVF
jgi:hypothetical protein